MYCDGDCADLSTFAPDGDGALPDGLGGDGRVDPEALMNAQPSVPGQTGDGSKVLPAVHHTSSEEQVELTAAPGAVHLAKAPALQLY